MMNNRYIFGLAVFLAVFGAFFKTFSLVGIAVTIFTADFLAVEDLRDILHFKFFCCKSAIALTDGVKHG